jgi:hypothetical protein
VIYRLTLPDGRVFGADGTDQTKRGMPTPPDDALREGVYWLTRPGWEISGSWILESASENDKALNVQTAEDPSESDVLYRDIFQVVLRKRA